MFVNDNWSSAVNYISTMQTTIEQANNILLSNNEE